MQSDIISQVFFARRCGMPIFRVLIRTLTRPWPLFTAAVIIALCFAARILLPVYFESIPVMLSLICCAVFCLTGVLFMAVPFVQYISAGTTLYPGHSAAPKVLIKTGFNALCRNPMYLGLVLFVLGLGIFISGMYGFIGAFLLFLELDRVQIPAEERSSSESSALSMQITARASANGSEAQPW